LYHLSVRVLGIDVGARRVGLAISDATGTLARPLDTIEVIDEADSVDRIVGIIERLQGDDDGLSAVVVGVPWRLDGSPTDATPIALGFIGRLKARTTLPIATEGERLTSTEAEQRLSATDRDWRRRKAKIDAAAAAVILQDYLDRRT
jgi:putative Holliday junction resolvase